MSRIDIYSQELTKEVELVSKESNTGITYYGVRMYLDRSAITFWIPNAGCFTQADLAAVFRIMAHTVDHAPAPTEPTERRSHRLLGRSRG